MPLSTITTRFLTNKFGGGASTYIKGCVLRRVYFEKKIQRSMKDLSTEYCVSTATMRRQIQELQDSLYVVCRCCYYSNGAQAPNLIEPGPKLSEVPWPPKEEPSPPEEPAAPNPVPMPDEVPRSQNPAAAQSFVDTPFTGEWGEVLLQLEQQGILTPEVLLLSCRQKGVPLEFMRNALLNYNQSPELWGTYYLEDIAQMEQKDLPLMNDAVRKDRITSECQRAGKHRNIQSSVVDMMTSRRLRQAKIK